MQYRCLHDQLIVFLYLRIRIVLEYDINIIAYCYEIHPLIN